MVSFKGKKINLMNYLLRHFDTVFEVVQGMYLSLMNVRLSDDFPCHFSTAFLEIFTAAFVAGAGPSLTILQSSNICLILKPGLFSMIKPRIENTPSAGASDQFVVPSKSQN